MDEFLTGLFGFLEYLSVYFEVMWLVVFARFGWHLGGHAYDVYVQWNVKRANQHKHEQ